MAPRITGRGVHPYSLRNTLQNPLARMLPLYREQAMVYRLGEKTPPADGLDGFGPTWEPVTMVLAAKASAQARVSLQRNFHLLALTGSSSSVVNGGYRAQFYDVKKKVVFNDRGIPFGNLVGTLGPVSPVAPFFLREPYPFDQPDSQILVMIQNAETVTNTIQLVFYGLAQRFNDPRGYEFPGGPVSSNFPPIGGGR